jgi:hypothetical protein
MFVPFWADNLEVWQSGNISEENKACSFRMEVNMEAVCSSLSGYAVPYS